MISLSDVTLTYQVYHDRSSSLKEFLINALHRRKFVDKRFSSFDALSKLSLTINPGERVGIIGRNGSGKSTLLKVMSGILKPSKGNISVDGKIQPLIEIAAGFNPEFSGRENIYLNGYMLGFSKRQISKQEEEIIAFSELGEFIDVPVKYYSSGMAVRLAFTIATAIDPDILLFDEMLSAGDAAFFEKAKRRMNDVIDRSRMVVLVTHDLGLVKSFTTRTIVLEHGKVIFDGEPNKAVELYLAMVNPKVPPPTAKIVVHSAAVSRRNDGEDEIALDFELESSMPMDCRNCTLEIRSSSLQTSLPVTGDMNKVMSTLGQEPIRTQVQARLPRVSERSLSLNFELVAKDGTSVVARSPAIVLGQSVSGESVTRIEPAP